MCGKPNPADAEVCRYCKARLTPLRPDDIPRPTATSELENTLPAWMQSLRGEGDAAPMDALPESEDLSLGLIGGETEPAAEEEAPAPDDLLWPAEEEDEDLPDWLKSLGDEPAPTASQPAAVSQPAPEPAPAADDAADDWLSSLADDTAFTDDAEAPADELLLGGSDNDLLGLAAAGETLAAEPAAPPAPETESADALDDVMGWLDDVADEAPAEAEETLVGLPDWLAEGGEGAPEAEAPAAVAGDLPDWLKDAGGADEAPAEAEETLGGLPDWLAEGGESAPEAGFPEAEAEAPAAVAGDLPDWLKDAGGVDEAPAEAEETLVGLPDWLAEGGESAPEADFPEAEAEEPTAVAGDLPDWLTEAAAPEEADAPLPQASDAGAEPAAGNLPDWLEAFAEEAGVSPDAVEAEFLPETEAEAPAAPQPFVEAADLPDEILSETPDWLKLLAPEDAEEIEAEPEAGAPALVAGEEAEGLAPGELPSWLEAMRPVAATPVGGAEEDAPVETSGPLAGLRGVLAPPEPALARPGKVAVIGGRLNLTDQQEKQARALQALLAEEFSPRPAPEKSIVSRQNALRWLLGLVILLAALVPFLLPPLRVPPPNKILPAALAAYQRVAEVPAGAPVLVGVDYSPGFASEMESAAAPVLDDLLSRGALLTVVSTQPTGPDLAAHLLESTLGARGYREGEHYLNLGYLPGGTAGLYAFARSPRLVLAYVPGHQEAWQTPMLASVQSLSDFALVLVITEDAETARAWLEQVQPVLDADTPLVMVISAQAEPMVEPYYETSPRQAAGIVTGVEGGMAYATMGGKTSPAAETGQWSSYSYIVLVAVLMMAMAGLYNLAMGWKEARERREIPDDEDIDEEEA